MFLAFLVKQDLTTGDLMTGMGLRSSAATMHVKNSQFLTSTLPETGNAWEQQREKASSLIAGCVLFQS